VALLCAACGQRAETQSYRLTLRVDDNAGPHVATSVISQVTRYPPSWASGKPAISSVEGEPPIVDLGGGRVVFATLAYGERRGAAGADCDTAVDSAGRAFRLSGLLAKERPVTGAEQLLLVTFTNPSRADSIEIVEAGHAPTVLGRDILAHPVQISPTSGSPAHGAMARRLPWLKHVRRTSAIDGKPWGTSYCDRPTPLSHALSPEVFLGG
jgi:hypothetical protein